MDKTEVVVFGLSTTSTSSGGYALILKAINSNKRIPIIIGGAEAHAIALELEGYNVPRPLTHDLLKNVITTLGGEVIEVNIVDLRDNTFFANIIIEQSGLRIEIDARPSDAIALALRTGSPIYIYDDVMDKVAFEPPENTQFPQANSLNNDDYDEDRIQQNDDEDEDEPFLREISKNDNDLELSSNSSDDISFLEIQLREALEKEDYERAAILRDKINKLKNNN
jgi:hypothetical protein